MTRAGKREQTTAQWEKTNESWAMANAKRVTVNGKQGTSHPRGNPRVHFSSPKAAIVSRLRKDVIAI